ncbi:MAG: dephospho-CoA kinase [Lachnospiraceae bacterium]|jgi:cytidylate kinase|nr:dephospho-CoA kinase [Lachnospiraceae bacterium]
MNISITGNLGSGKSSICTVLSQKGYEVISAGSIFRELAVERGLSVEEFNKKVNEDIKRGDRSVDDLIDKRTALLDSQRDNVVFDSRLAWNFAPRSFKVFVKVDADEAAKRVYQDSKRADSEKYDSLEQCKEALLCRQRMEQDRFRELYGLDYFNADNYDLVIESTHADATQIAEKILEYFIAYQTNPQKVVLAQSHTLLFSSSSDF